MNKLVILNISEIKAKKHPLLKLDKNPYLLEDRSYFDRRMIKKVQLNLEKLYSKNIIIYAPYVKNPYIMEKK